MNLTKDEMLELAEKCGAKVVYEGAQYTIFFESQLDLFSYTSAIEEKYQAQIAGLVAAGNVMYRELRACQAAIHLDGDFDPAYVKDAQAAMKYWDGELTTAKPISDAFIAEHDARERADFVQVLLAIGRHGALGLLDHLEDRAKRGEVYFTKAGQVTGIKSQVSEMILNEVADWMDAKGIAHVSANALRHYMQANISNSAAQPEGKESGK